MTMPLDLDDAMLAARRDLAREREFPQGLYRRRKASRLSMC
jgi:hypothetical protein